MTKKKVAIGPSSFAATSEVPLKMLIEAGVEVLPNPYSRRLTEDEIIIQLDEADGLIAGLEPLNRNVLSSAKKLKAVARVGIGMDNVDSDAAEDLGIKVSNTPDGPTRAVAELTMAALLSLCRQLPQMNADLHDGKWNKIIGLGLQGTDVLFIGFGRIGQAVADLLRPFGAHIFVYDPFLQFKEIEKLNGTPVSLEEGLKIAKVISLHASGNECILDKAEFAQMRQGVILLNSARAELVSEEAMTSAVKSGKIAGAWFDAFWREPYQGELQKHVNVLLTPHACTYSKQCRLSMETEAVENLLRDLEIS